jgi:16S rRNA (adenine1518-N6/adenine1519-N6)-dimethyltransferase
MTFYKPKELSSFLKEQNIHLKKSLSQNFLVDGNILNKIVNAAEIKEEDVVLEIGPGSGVLTKALLEKKAKVIAIEKDSFFAKHIPSLKKDDDFLEVFEADFLKFPLNSLQKYLQKDQKIKVVANIPFNITTPIISKLFKCDFISSITIMIQKEMAIRIVSKENTKDYSAFTIFVNFYSYPELMFNVSKNCFYPKPKVDSSVLKLTIRNFFPIKENEKFHEMVRKAFNQRRKKITSSLKGYVDMERLKKSLLELKLDNNVRPEDISFDNFVELFKKMF